MGTLADIMMSHQPLHYSNASPQLAALKSQLQTARLAPSFPKLPGVIFKYVSEDVSQIRTNPGYFPLTGHIMGT